MIILESMPDGYKYSNILLKLYLRSLRNGGKLMFNDRIPYNPTILAQVTRHSVGDVEKAIKIFKEMDILDVLENGAIYLLDIQNFIGKSTTEADRIRSYRKTIEVEKHGLLSTNDVQMYDKGTPKIEIELKTEIETETEGTKGNPKSSYQVIIDDFTKDESLKESIWDYIKMRISMKKKPTDRALKEVLKKLSSFESDTGRQIEILNKSIIGSWTDIYPLKDNQKLDEDDTLMKLREIRSARL